MEKLMIEKSDQLLFSFFKTLSEQERKHIGLMGGWAVHYLLKSRNVVHVGSRDIDIFFDPKEINPKILEQKLERMGFHAHSSFRWVKIFHSESEEELRLEESKKHPIYNLSFIYFDIATPAKAQHSMPEPLLKKVFGKEKQFIKIKGIEVMIPSAKILVEMKLKSAPERSDAFKRAKDIADLYTLLDANSDIWETKEGARAKTRGLDSKLVKKFKGKLARFKLDGTITAAANMINASLDKIIELLEKI